MTHNPALLSCYFLYFIKFNNLKWFLDSHEKLEEDWELKEWRRELSLDREKGGVGLQGVPGDDTRGRSFYSSL